jgi:hypothetical protein
MNIHAVYARVSPLFRRRRLARFLEVVQPTPSDRVIDLGGTADTWLVEGPHGAHVPTPGQITVLNPDIALAGKAQSSGFTFRDGDACALPFSNGSFDIAFSNSAIEHVGTWERQQAFATEARRVARRLWIQTPAREFFIEPHLIAPFIHWLPPSWQRRLIRNWTVRGWFDRPSPEAVDAFLREVRLLTVAEMQQLFPDCTILRERFLGLTKSYIAVRTR